MILSTIGRVKCNLFTEEKIIRIILYIALGIIIFILLISIFFINRYKKLSKKLELDVRQRTKELHETNELLRKANLELERISTIDKLTGIYNRRYFDNSIEKTWTIALRENHPVSLIMIDIDHFKVFNDTYGHLAGDQCLKSIANEIKDTLQRTGIVAVLVVRNRSFVVKYFRKRCDHCG